MIPSTVASTRRSFPPGRSVFVGGKPELARFRSLLVEPSPRVLFMHGIAGAGKSTLIHRFVAETPSDDDTSVLPLDCRDIEPTEAGCRAALVEALGFDPLDMRADDLRSASTRTRRTVICLDHYEVFRLLDTWIRQQLTPSLPDNVSLLIAGREEPNPAWTRLPAGTFEVIRLGPLSSEDSLELLRGMGVDEDDAASIGRFAGGHPLTLVLGALAAKEGASDQIRPVTMGRLLGEFTVAYLDDLGEETRTYLEAAAVVRRMSIPMMAAMLPDCDAMEGFDTLGRLPFVDAMSDGLALHTSIQESIATRLWIASPSRHRALRQRAWAYLREQLQSVPRAELWRHTADMIYLLENRAVREAHFPSTAHTYAIEPATPTDGAEIRAIVTRHEPPRAADLLQRWWNLYPSSFRVARDGRGAVAGFSIIASSSEVDLRQFDDDPVVSLWRDRLENDPLGTGLEALYLRRWLTWEGDGSSEAQAALWLDLKRMYMELRPRLRRIYSATDHPEVYGPALIQLEAREQGFAEIDGHAYTCYCLDFGPSSVDGWLTRVAARELGIEDQGLLDMRQRRLLVNGRRIDLTPKEFDVMAYLSEHAGDTVARTELLEAIWGFEEPLGSNVVDAVVYTLRKKLGSRAAELETVRGVGYRLAFS